MNRLLEHRLSQPLTLGQFIKKLAGVRPRLTEKLILDGKLLTPGEQADVFFYHGLDRPCPIIGPDAAAGVLAHYLANRLPMQPGVLPKRSAAIERYIANADKVRAIMATRGPDFELYRRHEAVKLGAIALHTRPNKHDAPDRGPPWTARELPPGGMVR